ncbi:MAG: hypothetical protein JNM17_22970 [Archangium sp.]|nr:hypothetical protein [Archangium sp.]
MNYMLIVLVVAALAWVFETIRELQKQNASLREEFERLRLGDRLKGLSSSFERLPLPVRDIAGTLEEFQLGMTEDEVFERVSKGGGITLESTSTLTYILEIANWRPERWSAHLEIHGGRLTRVELHGMHCSPSTRGDLEADLRKRLGAPTPEREPAAWVAEETKTQLAALAAKLQITCWQVPVLGAEVRLSGGTLSGGTDVTLAVQLV